MKITVDVDCTPEEARRFLGLPDLAPLHDIYLDKMKQAMDQGVGPEMLEGLMKSWGPMSEAGLSFWNRFFDQMGGGQAKK
ncbi:MAG: DUF6489 family protein [Parasphingopyxis sp.]